ncbi:MAG: hypothetical protein DMG67_04170 [Acidobacteria bacterium]|nr:MAG: hypothetical protein DMG67_04170 [Acidobacteriota bacterium]
MEEMGSIALGARRNEDIALDLMKFIAVTTGYGRGAAGGAGFQDAPTIKAEDYAAHLLELYGRCLAAVHGKK